MWHRLFLGCALSAVSAAPLAQSASAAAISKFSYTVTGGTFNGPYSTGLITGGAASFTPPVPIRTDTTIDFSAPGTIRLTLFGPTGYFRVLPTAAAGRFFHGILYEVLRGYPGFTAVTGSGGAVVRFPRGATPNAAARIVLTKIPHFECCYSGSGQGVTYGFGVAYGRVGGGPFTSPHVTMSHKSIIGNEVRTVVPEPAFAALLGLGLLALAFGGGSAAGVRRLHRR